MTNLLAILPYIQMVLSVLIVVAILLQKSEGSVGGAFGGNDNFSTGFHTRRGFEKTIFNFTIIIVLLFVISSILLLM